jgi:hypothetical protein
MNHPDPSPKKPLPDPSAQPGRGAKFMGSPGSLLAGFALLVFIRSPALFTDPRFWNEGGTVYFHHAYHNHWLKALLTPHLGYYSLVNNVGATGAANLLPLEYAPFFPLLMSFGVMLLLAAVVVLPGSPFETPRSRAVALLFVLLVPPAHSRWLTTNCSHFYLCAAAGLILVSAASRGGFGKWIRRLALFLGGFTGVVSAFLTPLYW